MHKVVGVRFKEVGKIYYFSPRDLDIENGDQVLVETSRGTEFGTVVAGPMDVPEDELKYNLKDVLKIAEEEDILVHQDNLDNAKEAMIICQEKILDHGLDMDLLSAEYTFDKSKLIFNFASENRVDFRDLVRDLASIFRTRIELRQIGVRDEAKIKGALGCCGRETCCSKFLCDFKPVTIKMAKDQSFSLNPGKISGQCGRLMCCLAYEQDGYEEVLSKMPQMGSTVYTDQGPGTVVQVSPMQELVRVRFELDDEISQENFYISELLEK